MGKSRVLDLGSFAIVGMSRRGNNKWPQKGKPKKASCDAFNAQ
jgi:hypothetical protein